MAQEMEETKTTGRSQTGKIAKGITTPDLHLSQTKLKKIQPRSPGSASKHAALATDGENENKGDYTE